MEKVTSALLKSALQGTEGRLQKRLPEGELAALGILLEQTARRYPNQDLADTLEEYLKDFEQLSLKYSPRKVENAIAKLRIDPEQKFFPSPSDVADEIENQMERGVNDAIRREGEEWFAYWENWKEKLNSPEERAWRKEKGYDTDESAEG